MIKRTFLIITFILTGCTFLLSQEKGMASYYSNRLHGRKMSDGTRYHKDSLTCAHKRYPLGTMLKVTNIKNGKTVIVKVTDRCGSRRIIDLSYAAAKKLGMVSAGVAMVKVEKYLQPLGIPFKPEEYTDLPELDYEITEKHDDNTPIWMRNDKEDKPTTENEPTNKADKEKPQATKKGKKHNK